MGRILPCLAGLVVLLCVTTPCHAQSTNLRVWADAPQGCIDTDEWRARVQAGLPSGETNGESWRLVLRLTPDVGTLWIQASDGAWTFRTLEGTRCADIAEALAVVAAMALEQPEHADWMTTPPPAFLARPPAPPPVARPVPVSPPDRTSVYGEAGTGVTLAGGLGPGLGVFPHVAGAIGSSGSFAPRLRLTLATAFPRKVRTASGLARLHAWDVQLQPCVGQQVFQGVTARGCGVFGLTALVGTGEETLDPATETRTLARAGAAARLDLLLFDQLVLDFGVGTTFALSRPRFYFAPNETAYQVPQLALTGDLSITARF